MEKDECRSRDAAAFVDNDGRFNIKIALACRREPRAGLCSFRVTNFVGEAACWAFQSDCEVAKRACDDDDGHVSSASLANYAPTRLF